MHNEPYRSGVRFLHCAIERQDALVPADGVEQCPVVHVLDRVVGPVVGAPAQERLDSMIAVEIVVVERLRCVGLHLDQAPLLIEALKDPDPLVFSAANDALRFMSRKFYGAGFWGGSDEKTRQDAIAQWKAWYLSIRPGAILD